MNTLIEIELDFWLVIIFFREEEEENENKRGKQKKGKTRERRTKSNGPKLKTRAATRYDVYKSRKRL